MGLNQIVKAVEIENAGEYPAKRLNQRERKALEVADSYLPAAGANWGATPPTGQDAALDALAAANPISPTAIGSRRTVAATYDFSVQGGGTGTTSLGVTIPDNAVVVQVAIDVLTAPDSAGDNGTIKLVLPTDGDLSATITADGAASGVSLSAAVPKKTTAARLLSVTIATSALIAGKVNYLVTYIISE